MPDAFALDPRLAQDTVPLGDLKLSRVLAMNDANYPWLILVPRRPHLVELIDLDRAEQAELMQEIAHVAGALKTVTGCHKLNIAALGNAVAQLHIHVIARFSTDAAWPNPVWGRVPARPYEAVELQRFGGHMRDAIGFR